MKIRLLVMFVCLSLVWMYLPAFSNASAAAALDENRLFKKMDQLNSEQMIIVTADHNSSISGKLYIYKKKQNSWQHQLGPVSVVFGKNGLGKTKEGDNKTPIGTYTIGTAFGSSDTPPAGLMMDYRSAGPDDYWVDDPRSPDYNNWVAYEGNPSDYWRSFERLNNPLYQYAVAINYNTHPVVPGKGSAIFMHIWRSSNKPTQGCIAMSKADLLRVMGAIDPDKNPKIRIAAGTAIY